MKKLDFKAMKGLLPYLKGSKRLLSWTIFSVVLSTGSKLAIPYVAGKAVNEILEKGALADLSVHFILMASFLVLGTLFGYLFQFLTSLIGQRVIRQARSLLYESLLLCPIRTIDESSKGDFVNRMLVDVENIQTGLVAGLASFLEGIVTILVTMGFMFSLNWLLALIVVVLTPVSLLVSRAISKFNSKHFKGQAKSQSALVAYSREGLENSETVRAYELGEERIKEFDRLNEENRKDAFRANMGASVLNPATRLVNSLINAILIFVGAATIIMETPLGIVFLVGDLSSFLTYASNYMNPFNEISNVMSEIDYAVASFRRVDALVRTAREKETGEMALPKAGPLSAAGIRFSYVPGKEVIRGFSLAPSEGKRIALVGPTGCGKTTLINLILRFYDPDSGAFLLNGHPITSYRRSDIRRKVGMVLQDSWIFQGTVRENIAYGKPDATIEEVEEAARRAQAASFIERLPKGYDTMIGEGSALSKGERQLISVARVLLLSPEIVILDEATSNIDMRTEALLGRSFRTLMEGKTSIVVAHRLSTIVESDLIIVLKDGEIIEEGTHKELMEADGFYHSLYSAQFE